jgi:hypothetical protein
MISILVHIIRRNIFLSKVNKSNQSHVHTKTALISSSSVKSAWRGRVKKSFRKGAEEWARFRTEIQYRLLHHIKPKERQTGTEKITKKAQKVKKGQYGRSTVPGTARYM